MLPGPVWPDGDAGPGWVAWLDAAGLWVGPAVGELEGDDEVLGEPVGEGDGLGEVLGVVELELALGLGLGEPDGLDEGDLADPGEVDLQLGEDRPGELEPMPPGPLL